MLFALSLTYILQNSGRLKVLDNNEVKRERNS